MMIFIVAVVVFGLYLANEILSDRLARDQKRESEAAKRRMMLMLLDAENKQHTQKYERKS